MLNIPELTQRILDNKRKRGWNITDLNKEFCYLNGEVAEAVEASNSKSQEELAFELADICIFLFGIAGIANVDLRNILIHKISKVNYNNYLKKEREYLNVYFLRIYSSVSKAYEAYCKKTPNFDELLGEIFANVYVISFLYRIDLFEYIEKKVEINEKREYEKINGVDIKKEDVEAYKKQIENQN